MSESSPEPSPQPSEPRLPPSGAPLPDEHRGELAAGGDEEIFELADDQPAAQPAAESSEPPKVKGAEAVAEWYFAQPGGQPQGPFTLAEMQRRVASGQLRPADMVWCRAIGSWAPMREVEILHGPATAGAPPPLLRGQRAGASWTLSTSGAETLLAAVDRFFARPLVYRVIGRVCAVVGVVVVVFSLALLWIGIHWFTGALVLGLIFVVGEAAGAILEAIERSAAAPRAAEKPAKPPA